MKISCIMITIIVASTLLFADKTSPIAINPELLDFDSLPTIQNLSLYIGTVDFSHKDQPLGYTRTGRKTKAPIVCSPTLDSVLYLSMARYVTVKKMKAPDINTANYIMNISVLKAEINETTSGLTQTMTATLKINVTLTNPQDSTQHKSFKVESQYAKTTLDTTKSAKQVVQGVIEGVFRELIKSISPN